MAEAAKSKKNDSCCPPGSTGPAIVLHGRKPSGKMVEIPAPEGFVGAKPMPCYCTGEPLVSTSRIVVVFTDVYGIDAGHHKVFADCLAERLKCSVLLPDLFRGEPIMRPWIKNTSMAKDIVGSLMGAPGMVFRVKRDYPPQKVEADIFHMIVPFIEEQLPSGTSAFPPMSCVGFCFGGWVVGRILGHNQQQALYFQCGVGIHPSFHPSIAHGETPTTMARRIRKPILLLPAWNDVDMKPGTSVVKAITANRVEALKNKRKQSGADPEEPGSTEAPTVSIEFPSMLHGWVSRGDPTDEKIAMEQDRALQLTAEFIEQNEKRSS